MIYVFTHTDLDGVISGLFIKHYFENDSPVAKNVTIKYCSAGSYGNLTSTIEKVLNNPTADIEHIFVTDLTPEDATLAKLQTIIPFSPVTVLDHHESSLDLAAKYPTMIINKPVINQHPSCAATLVYDYLNTNLHNQHQLLPQKLAEITRSYDTWDWQLDENDQFKDQARDFDNLLFLYGKEIFIKHTLKALENDQLISDEDQLIAQLHQQRNDTYIKMKLTEIEYTSFKIDNNTVVNAGVVCASHLFSELGNAVLETTDPQTNDKCHLAIMISNGKLSLRSDDNVDASKIASLLNGGGHPKASGAKINFDPVQLIQNALNSNIKKEVLPVEKRTVLITEDYDDEPAMSHLIKKCSLAEINTLTALKAFLSKHIYNNYLDDDPTENTVKNFIKAFNNKSSVELQNAGHGTDQSRYTFEFE